MRAPVPLMLLGFAAAALAACGEGQAPASPAAPAPPEAPAAPPTPEAPPTPAGAVPEAFRGEWNTDLSACGTGESETRLRIEADRIAFYESSGPVTDADFAGDTLTVTVELTGEGETFTRTHRFALSEGGQTLTDLDGGLVRRRCPA